MDRQVSLLVHTEFHLLKAYKNSYFQFGTTTRGLKIANIKPTLGTTLRHFRLAHLHKIHLNVILPSPCWSSLQTSLTEYVVLNTYKKEEDV